MNKSHMTCRMLSCVMAGTTFVTLFFLADSVRADFSKRTVWTTQDVVDERITVDAQYSLIRKCRSQDPAARDEATSILAAILDDKSLAGIYQVDYRASADRAKLLKLPGWWKLLLPTELAKCVGGTTKHGKTGPMIVYRKKIATYKEHLDKELSKAWRQCSKAHSITQRKAIPCNIGKRTQSDNLDCLEVEWGVWDRIYNECFETRVPQAARAACQEACAKTTPEGTWIEWNCVYERPECASVAQNDKICKEYADKNVAGCP